MPKPFKSHSEKRDQYYRYHYGISLEDYEALLRIQNGVCAICQQENSLGHRLCVDHDHRTGRVRGLLCHSCNKGVGFFKDRPDLLHRTIRYLDGFASNN